MQQRASLVERLGIEYPIIQAPMAGGGSTAELVAAVGRAGGMGFLGCAYSTPDEIRRAVADVRSRTDRPFGLNLFAPQPPAASGGDASHVLGALREVHIELGLEAPSVPEAGGFDFREQLDAVLRVRPPAFSFTFGLLPVGAIDELHAQDIVAMGTATTVDEAVALEQSGVDAIVTQGSEAGAHRGTFAATFEAAMIGTLALVPQVVDAVAVPVVASGGIMDGRGVAAVLTLGAQAAQLGTAFLTCEEAGIPAAHKAAILEAREDQTRITRAFSGRPARGIVNRLMSELDRDPTAILPFPLQNAVTRPARTAAAEQGRAEFLSLWAGQGVRMARALPAETLVRQIAEEMAIDVARGGAP